MDIKSLTDEIVKKGFMTHEEYKLFMDTIDADGVTDKDEEAQIKRVLKMVQNNELKINPPEQTS